MLVDVKHFIEYSLFVNPARNSEAILSMEMFVLILNHCLSYTTELKSLCSKKILEKKFGKCWIQYSEFSDSIIKHRFALWVPFFYAENIE